MFEEFFFGFVPWADRYFGSFDWTQNIIGNAIFFTLLIVACCAYYINSNKYLWLGMAGAMWVLSNAFIHLSSYILGGEYSPSVVTATLLYLPGGIYLLVRWAKLRLLNIKNLGLSFAVGAMAFMIIPTYARAIVLHAKLAQLFHLVS